MLTATGLVLQNNGGNNLSVPANATSFTFSTAIASGATYQVTVLTQPTGLTCTVTNGVGAAAANVANVAVACAASANAFTIGGAVTGLAGTGLVLQNNGGGNLSIAANGNFAFATPQSSGSAYQVTVLTQPSGQNCIVNSPGGTVAAANVTTVAVTCISGYTIGGTVTGLVGTVVLRDSGSSGDTVFITTDGNFTLPTPHPSVYLYVIQIQTNPAGQTCVVSSGGTGLVGTANVTNVVVTCSAKTYTIGGTISGLTTIGLVLQNNGGDNRSVNAGATNFTFSAAIASGAPYGVTVLTQPTGQTCTVNASTGTVVATNVTTVAVTCSASAFTIGGTVTGLAGTGLVLQNNGGNNLPAASGVYAFTTPLAFGSTYNVTVLTQPTSPTQICTVANASGTVAAAVTNADVSCVNAYTIGGTITGAAAGAGPILQNNLGDNLFIPAIASGVPTAFTFSTPVADGAGYSVTQSTRARAPSQDCSAITGGSGTVAGSNVTTVSITCVLSLVVPKFAYVANSTAYPAGGAADTVSAYTIAGSGTLTAATTPTTASGDGPYSVSVDPTGQFAYAVNSNADSVSVYSIAPVSGVLAVIDADGATAGIQASIATGDNPKAIAVHPSGKFAYVANQGNRSTTGNTLSAYSINITSGALSAIDADAVTGGTQSTIATGSFPNAATIDPLGKFIYVADYDSNTISAYTIDQTSGALTPVGSPVAAGTGPSSVAIDPAGKCALVANNTSDDVKSYTINQTTGALTPVTTTAAVTGSAPRSVAVDPNTGLYAYAANAGTGTISAYSLNPTTCALAPIDTDAATAGTQATIAAGSAPISINVDPSGQFIYVANYGSNNVSVYGIGAGGALTLLQTLSTGSGPASVTTTQ